MMELYPNATKKFCDWIDEYKKEVNWNILFNDGYMKCLEKPIRWIDSSAPKFHDLPHAMQQGIWLEYLCQRGGCTMEIEDFFNWDLKTDIEEMFREVLEQEASMEKELQ